MAKSKIEIKIQKQENTKYEERNENLLYQKSKKRMEIEKGFEKNT